MGSIAERVIGGALDLFYRLKHPNAIVSRRVAEYLEEEFGPPQKKGRGILFWHRRPKNKLPQSVRQYLDNVM